MTYMHVFFMFELRSVEEALAFVNAPENAKIGEESGVIDGEYHIVEDA